MSTAPPLRRDDLHGRWIRARQRRWVQPEEAAALLYDLYFEVGVFPENFPIEHRIRLGANAVTQLMKVGRYEEARELCAEVVYLCLAHPEYWLQGLFDGWLRLLRNTENHLWKPVYVVWKIGVRLQSLTEKLRRP